MTNNKIPQEIEEIKGVRSSVYDSIKLDIIERYGKQFYEDFVGMLKYKGFQEGQKQSEDAFKEMILEFGQELNKVVLTINKKCPSCKKNFETLKSIKIIDRYSKIFNLSKIGEEKQDDKT